MAHTDACKIQIIQFCKKLTDDKGISPSKAFELAEKESDGIPANTIRRWWYEALKEIEKEFKNEQVTTTTLNHSEKQENQVCEHGGAREGSGRPPKYAPEPKPWSCAMQMAGLAIGQLSRIPDDDPKRQEAFQKVIAWIKEN